MRPPLLASSLPPKPSSWKPRRRRLPRCPAAGWAEWAEWITKTAAFAFDFARKAPERRGLFRLGGLPIHSGASRSHGNDGIEKEALKINKLGPRSSLLASPGHG